jgi:uncharacterized protein YegP (UPF0339 family)
MAKRTLTARDWRILQPPADVRRGYTYFIMGDPETGYHWTLTDRNGNDLARSDAVYRSKADCLKTLRATQRHAESKHIVDDAQ